ncbi:MAG TPA: LapA family protein [Ancylobacter sp.]
MLAVANRHSIGLVVDPIGGDGALTLQAPLFLVVFGALIVGVLIGGIVVWLSQGRYRRAARRAGREARRANAQVDALRATVPASVTQTALSHRPATALPDHRDAA